MAQAPRPHLLQFDLLRGAAIIAVVYLHAYFTPWPGVSGGAVTAMRVLHLFANSAVPLFLFVAAFLQARGGRESPAGHLRGRLWSTWVPVAVWLLLAALYRLATEGASLTLLRDVVLLNVAGQYYFIWLIFLFGLALTQAWRLSERQLGWAVAAALAVNAATIAAYEVAGSLDGLPAILAYRNPLAWIFFPALGYWLGRNGRATVPRSVATLAASGMGVALAGYVAPGVGLGYWPASYFGLSVFTFSACAMLVYPTAATVLTGARAVERPLLGLARYAFPIYLVHIPFVMGIGTREILGEGASWSNYWLLLHANFAVGLLVSLAVVRELDKASPFLGRFLLGVRRRRPRRKSLRPPTTPDHGGAFR